MEEFQRVDIFVDTYQRHVELQRVEHQVAQGVGRDVVAEESIGHPVGYLRKGERVYFVEEGAGKRSDGLWHEQALVFHHSLFERGRGGLLVGTVV